MRTLIECDGLTVGVAEERDGENIYNFTKLTLDIAPDEERRKRILAKEIRYAIESDDMDIVMCVDSQNDISGYATVDHVSEKNGWIGKFVLANDSDEHVFLILGYAIFNMVFDNKDVVEMFPNGIDDMPYYGDLTISFNNIGGTYIFDDGVKEMFKTEMEKWAYSVEAKP